MADVAIRIGAVGRIYGNLGKLLGGKAAAGVISLGYLSLAARTLGPADYGVLMLVHGYAMAVAGLAGLPGWQAVVRYGARAVAAGDDLRLVRLLRLVAVVEGAGAVLAVVAAAACAPLIGPRLGWSPQVVWFALPYSLAVLSAMRMTPMGYLQLVGRFDLLGAHHLVSPLVRLAGVLTAVALHAGLRGFLVVWLLSTLAEGASMWIFGLAVARRRLGARALAGPLDGAVAENPGFWRFLLAAKADVSLSDAPLRLIPLIIGWVLGPAAVGLYAIAQQATVVLAQPAQILGQAAFSELARLAAGEPGPVVRAALVRCVTVAALAACPIALGIMILARPIAVAMGGAAFAAAAPLMAWFALARAIAVLGPPLSAALTALGRPSRSMLAHIGGIAALALLAPTLAWGGLAAAGPNIALQSVTVAGLMIWFVRRETAPMAPKGLRLRRRRGVNW